jgi:hypothetical protein
MFNSLFDANPPFYFSSSVASRFGINRHPCFVTAALQLSSSAGAQGGKGICARPQLHKASRTAKDPCIAKHGTLGPSLPRLLFSMGQSSPRPNPRV